MKKTAISLTMACLFGAFFYFDLHTYLSFERIKAAQSELQAYTDQNFILAFFTLSGVYILTTALSLPGAAILTLLAGALFGVFYGTVLASISSTLGATGAFLCSRYLFKDWVESRFKNLFGKINSGIEKEGAFYLFSIRMIPAFPFFIVNLLMGLTKIPTFTYMWASMAGMFLGTVVYVNAGTRLSELESLSGIASAEIIGSFVALGILPVASKKLIAYLRNRK